MENPQNVEFHKCGIPYGELHELGIGMTLVKRGYGLG